MENKISKISTNKEDPKKSKEDVLAERKARKLAKKQGIKKSEDGLKTDLQRSDKVKCDDAARKATSVPTVVPSDVSAEPDKKVKSKAELRKERRQIQEAQREAKKVTHTVPSITPPKESTKEEVKNDVAVTCEMKVAENGKPSIEIETQSSISPGIDVFRQKLLDYAPYFAHLLKEMKPLKKPVHPALVKLGMQYEDGIIVGTNARCIALLYALKMMIYEYVTPPKKDFSRDLSAKLEYVSNYLDGCRSLSLPMVNAFKYLRRHLTNIPSEWSDIQAKEEMYQTIDQYLNKIDLADVAICDYALDKISDGDVVITYGCSSIVCRILEKAWNSGKRFKVIVLDSRPHCEGISTLRKLVKEGLCCTYAMITAGSYMMQEATTVLLGAHCLLANGYVVSRAGTSQIAILAQKYNKPVLVCCESHKFSDTVLTDSFTYNELGKVDDLLSVRAKNSPLSAYKDNAHILLLNLQYDVTPANLVTAIITELGMLPCSSVPVVLRVQHSDMV